MRSQKKASLDLSVNVSNLKTHLGRYLKKVKDGAEVIVLDRQMPVAKLVAFSGDEFALTCVSPTLVLNEVLREMSESDKKKAATKLKRNSLSYLNDDRGGT